MTRGGSALSLSTPPDTRPGRYSRRTRIICTLGPSSASREALDQLVAAGMDVARLNFSHGTHAWHAELIQRIRDGESRWGRAVAILLDLQGPKLRLGRFRDGTAHLEAGAPRVENVHAPLSLSLRGGGASAWTPRRRNLISVLRDRAVRGDRLGCSQGSGSKL